MNVSGVSQQPSRKGKRKGKKAWRKNINLTDVEEKLEEIRSEERATGGRYHDQPNEALFVRDTTGDLELKKSLGKGIPHLRVDDILAERSKIAAIASKPSKLQQSEKKKESRMEKARLEQMVRRKYHLKKTKDFGPSEAVKRAGQYDVWANDVSLEEDDHDLPDPSKFRKIKPPKTLKMKPASNVRAVYTPHPGASYNPTFEDHQALLRKANEDEVQKESEKEKLKAKLPVNINGPASVLNPEDMIDKQDSDGEEDREEIVEINPIKSPMKKNRKKANKRMKLKRKREAEIAAAQKEALKAKRRDLHCLSEIVQEVETELAESKKRAKSAELNVAMPLKKIGKYKVTQLPLEVQLTEELPATLRELKPEGSMFRERMASFQQRNLVEPRVPVAKKRKHKVKFFERGGYK